MQLLENRKANLAKFTCTILLAGTFLSSCTKPATTPPPQMSQRDREFLEPLKENEIIEDGAVRFVLNYADAVIDLQGSGLDTTQLYVNYYLEEMPDNSEIILFTEFKSITKPATFDLKVEGFTASTNTKRFSLTGIPFTLADAGVKKEFIKVKKGIVKYTFIRL